MGSRVVPIVSGGYFLSLGGIGQAVTALVVPIDSPFKSAKDLIDYANTHPEKRLRWSHPGGLPVVSLGVEYR